MMNDTRVMSMEELQVFLRSSGSLKFNGYSRTEAYAWIEKTLRQYKYLARPRAEKGLLRQYLRKMSGYSPAQLTRLIDQFHSTTHLRVRPYRRHCFPTKFTPEDQFLLAEVDEVHERLSGPATQAILRREYELFGREQFQRLSTISVTHLYRLRQSPFYLNQVLTVHKTKPATARYGERRCPDPQGQPGYLRVDTIHQGDWNGEKGVYHINTIDAVTQWEIVGCVERISERYLVPVLKDLLTQYPFVIHGFHSDNGSEFINHVVANLLNKLLVEFTKSRARHTNDQALVEGKNGSIIRKQMGHWHIPQPQAGKIQSFYKETFNTYLNFHRPCGFATETVDNNGKINKKYDTYLTPFEKLNSLTHPEQFLKQGVTLDQLENIACSYSDTEYAKLMQHKKAQLFRSFSKPGILA